MRKFFHILNIYDAREAPCRVELNDDENNKGRIMDDETIMHEMQVQEA